MSWKEPSPARWSCSQARPAHRRSRSPTVDSAFRASPTSPVPSRSRVRPQIIGYASPMSPPPPPDRIPPDDPRYRAVVDKRFNKRFAAAPDYVRIATTTADVVAAVGDAVRENRRLVVTSGGHCLEGFVSDPEVKVILDVSPMKQIAFDADRAAIVVEAGAHVGDTLTP